MIMRCLILVVFMLCWVSQALGQMTLGAVVPNQSLFPDEAAVREVGRYLEQHMGEPVAVRIFPDTPKRHQWISRFQEVDLAILESAYAAAQPAGEFFYLGSAGSTLAEGLGQHVFVARKGLDSIRMTQLAKALDQLVSSRSLSAISQADAPSFPLSTSAPDSVSDSVQNQPSAPLQPPSEVERESSETTADGGAGLVPATAEGPVNLGAQHLTYDKPNQSYLAEGEVLLQRGSMTLEADKVEFNGITGEALASGNVKLTDPKGVMEGERLSYNLNTGHGRLSEGRVLVPEKNLHLSGEEIEKFGEWQFRVTQGTYTTCDGEVPSWKFGSSSLDVTLGGYAKAKNVLFYIHDVPVLYFPFMIYPAKTERESGLLLPRYGHSTNRGTLFSLGYYQVIERNQDATLRLDYMSELGIGKGLEYRYIFDGENEGISNFYHVTGIEGELDMYSFNWKHTGMLQGGARLLGDVDWVSSRDFKARMGDTYDVYTREAAISVVAAQKNWGKLDLSGQIKHTKELEAGNDLTLQRYPEVRLTQVSQRLSDTPVFFRFDSFVDNFRRHDGDQGQRLMLRPELSTEYFSNEFFVLVPFVGFRQHVYRVSDGMASHGTPDVGARLSTTFSRVFRPEYKGVSKLLHRIEPQAEYHYIPNWVDRGLPAFDGQDNREPQNGLTYALVNWFTVRIEPEEGDGYDHEFLYLKISQVYDIREERRSQPGAVDDSDVFSPVNGEAIFRPTRWSLLDINFSYDVNNGDHFNSYSVLGEIRDDAGNSLGLNYTFERDLYDYVSTDLTTALFKPFFLGYQLRQDLKGGRTLENQIDLEYRGQCWSVFLTYRDRIQAQEYLISFSLTGLGRVGSLTGRLDRSE